MIFVGDDDGFVFETETADDDTDDREWLAALILDMIGG